MKRQSKENNNNNNLYELVLSRIEKLPVFRNNFQ